MIQNNARISDAKGLVFYEQDILYDDHVYTEDMEIELALDYISPGFGIALMNSEGLPLSEQKETYLFRIGYREVSIVYKNTIEQRRIKTSAAIYQPPIVNAKMRLVKKGKIIQLFFQDMTTPIIEYGMPIHWDRYSIGFYSNAGNIIKKVETAASVPQFWTLNMYNTDGGHIKFLKSGFTFINCKDKAEIEQPRIPLKAGMYYLQYDSLTYNGKYDIEAFVFDSNDVGIRDEVKNILTDKNSFVLEEAKEITIKFKGHNGTINNINLSEKLQTSYVPTMGDEGANSLGSYIRVNTEDISKIWWIGQINELPKIAQEDFYNKNKEYFIAATDDEHYYWQDSKLELNTDYNFVYDVDKYTLTISNKDNTFLIAQKDFTVSSTTLTIFKNVDAIITKLSVMKFGQTEWEDLIVSSSSKKYVTTDVSSPILVTDAENVPLDLSSSYRYWYLPNNKRHYEFTNWEREIFETDTFIKLDKLASEKPGSIITYGVFKGADIDQTRFYETNGKDIHDLTPFTKHHERIYTNMIRHIDYIKGEVYFESDVIEKYDYIVIDYLKKDSYAINLRPTVSLYEIDIASENKETMLLYDKPVMQNNTLQANDAIHLGQVKTTEFRPSDASYIVLRKEGYYENLSRETSDPTDQEN